MDIKGPRHSTTQEKAIADRGAGATSEQYRQLATSLEDAARTAVYLVWTCGESENILYAGVRNTAIAGYATYTRGISHSVYLWL